MDDHGVPVLPHKEFVFVPLQCKVGVTQPEVVNSGVGGSGEIPLDEGSALRSPYFGAVDSEIDPGSDGQHVGLPPVINVSAKAVAHNRLGVEEHHILTSTDYATAVGIVVGVDKTMEAEMKALLSL